MARVAVVGVGAIGGAVAAGVHDAGVHELVACMRTPADGIEVTRHDGTVRLDARICTDPAEVDVVDWVLLATKAYQTAAASVWLDRLCGSHTAVAVLQNGIDHVERVQPLVPRSTVLPVVVQLPAEKDAPGVIRQSHPGILFVPAGAAGDGFAELLAAADTEVRVVTDFTTALWQKLVINSAMGAVALVRRRNDVAGVPAMADALGALVREAAAVGRAEGADLGDDVVDRMLTRVTSAGGHLSSITTDLIEGRPLEWEVRNAVIGRLGRKHGIATPLHDQLTALLSVADPASSAAS